MAIFFETKNTRILIFLVEQYTTKTDIIRYYLLPNSIILNICNQINEYVAFKNKYILYIYLYSGNFIFFIHFLFNEKITDMGLLVFLRQKSKSV